MKTAARLAPLALILLAGAATATTLVVQVNDATGKPLADTIVYAEPEGGNAPKAPHPAEIEQRGLKFLPIVTVIQTGSQVSFPNNDKVRHHIYSFSPAKKFDQKLYSGVTAAPQVFDKAGTVVLGCNIHDRMIAYVKVVDTPYFAKTDAAGVARIELPVAGKYSVTAWHYNMVGTGSAQQLAVSGAAPQQLAYKLALKPNVSDPDSPSPGY
jgi:plastocyanin